MRLPPLMLLAATLLLAPVAGAATERVVDVTLRDDGCPPGQEFCIEPARLAASHGDDLRLRIHNAGQVRHNLTFASGTPGDLARHGHPEPIEPGANASVVIPWEDLEAALEDAEVTSFTLQCGFDGHATLGERTTLTVEDAGGGQERPQPLGWSVALVALVGAALLLRRGRT